MDLSWVDSKLFLLINQLPHTTVSNSIALAVSGFATMGLFWIVIAAFILWREEQRDHWFFLPLVSGMGMAWFLVERCVKPLFGRIRPIFSVSDTITVLPIPTGYSFPSGHATIAFAGAFIIANHDRRLRIPVYLLATIVSFSRVYLGHHFPTDVVAGGILGVGIGWFTMRIYRYIVPIPTTTVKTGGIPRKAANR